MIQNLNIITLAILIFSSIMVILSHNPIHSTLFLILSYVAAAGILLVLKSEFIALILITVYVGAVVVLFLFVILMIDTKNYIKLSYFFYSLLLGFIFLIEILFLVFENFNLNAYFRNNFFLTDFFRNWVFTKDISIDIEAFGQTLSVYCAVHLLISGLILFLGIISSVFLSFNFQTKKTKFQTIYRQLSKNYSKSLFLRLAVETNTLCTGASFSLFDIINSRLNSMTTSTIFNIELIELSLIPEFFLGFSSIVLSIFFSLIVYSQRYSFRIVQKVLLSLSSIFFSLTTVLLINDCLVTSSKQISLNSLSFFGFLSLFSKLMLLTLSYFCLWTIWKYIIKDAKLNHSEYILLFIYISLGLVLLISTNDLLSLFITLELQGLSLYIIYAFKKDSIHSIHSGLKYFILGALSSSLFLFGASFIYKLTGVTHFFSFNLLLFEQQMVESLLKTKDSGFLLILSWLAILVFLCELISDTLDWFNISRVQCADKNETYIATLQVIFGFSLAAFLIFFAIAIAEELSPDAENEPESPLNTPDKQEENKTEDNAQKKKEDDKSTKSSGLTEYSNKYFDPTEKSMYNFFKTVMLAIPAFMIILLCGLFFKVAAAPFHLWVLDIYEGSPTSSTLIFAVLTKISILVIIIKICYYCFYAFYVKNLSQCINLTGLFSIFIGSVVGLSERKIKSLLTFSSINNIGYLLLALATSVKNSLHSIFMYLINYTNANLALWAVIITIQLKKNRFTQKLNKDFSDSLSFIKKNKMLLGVTIVILFSLAGIPPFIGFFSKMECAFKHY